jgi:hypothetical protein
VDRSDLIDRLWSDSPLFLSREEFARTLDGWELEPVMQDGKLAVIFVTKGPEFHFAKLDPAYQCTREILRRFPGEVIERHGYALTKTPKDDLRQMRFNQRLGFYRIGEDEYDIHLRIDTMRHTKERPCP